MRFHCGINAAKLFLGWKKTSVNILESSHTWTSNFSELANRAVASNKYCFIVVIFFILRIIYWFHFTKLNENCFYRSIHQGFNKIIMGEKNKLYKRKVILLFVKIINLNQHLKDIYDISNFHLRCFQFSLCTLTKIFCINSRNISSQFFVLYPLCNLVIGYNQH